MSVRRANVIFRRRMSMIVMTIIVRMMMSMVMTLTLTMTMSSSMLKKRREERLVAAQEASDEVAGHDRQTF